MSKQPPSKPHPVPFWKWPLLLFPAAIAIALITMARAATQITGPSPMRLEDFAAALSAGIAVPLSFALGRRLDKWRRGKVEPGLRRLALGAVILAANIALCAAVLSTWARLRNMR